MFMLAQLSRWLIDHSPELLSFMLVFARAAGLITGAPFWGSRMVAVPVRIWIAFLLAVATFPLARAMPVPQSATLLSLTFAIGTEFLLGVVLGWVAQLLFAGMRIAGQAIEAKSSLGFLQIVDPHEGSTTGIFAALLEVLAGLMFFALNGHHLLIQALNSSYSVFPISDQNFLSRLLGGVIGSGGQMFAIGLRVSAPVVIGLLLSDVVLGILSRTIPQMNIFLVAQPLQFGLAVFLLMLSLPAIAWFFAGQLPTIISTPGGR